MKVDKKYALYVFDFDGTLVDTREDIARGFGQVLEEFGYEKPAYEQCVAAIGGGARRAIMKLTGAAEEDIEAPYARFHALYQQICADNTYIYDGGKELLLRLKAQGAKVAVVTMKYRAATEVIVEKLGIDMLDDLITSDDVDNAKPDPSSMIHLLEKHGLSASDALMVGDTTTDMRFAKNAGVDACAVTYGYGKTEDILAENPQYVVDSLRDF